MQAGGFLDACGRSAMKMKPFFQSFVAWLGQVRLPLAVSADRGQGHGSGRGGWES